MKKSILAILILISFAANSQSITIPVSRISVNKDSTLFNFTPYTILLKVTAGATFGNTNFYYRIDDSTAANTPHLTPFGQPFSRSSMIDGIITLPTSFFLSAFDANKKPIVATFNQILGFMDMQVDTKRNFIIE